MKAANHAHSALRTPGERANAAEPKNWRILRKVRSSPSAMTTLVEAVMVLIRKSRPRG